jgi:endonuclease YncB( thermonuclease family)
MGSGIGDRMQDQEAFLTIALFLVLVAYSIFKLGKPRRSRPKIGTDAPRVPRGIFIAKVEYVIDGDTVDVMADRQMIRIRLDSIDCPEDGQYWGDTAKAGLIKLIGGKSVRLENHGTDIHGRTLATLYVSQDGRGEWLNVNERMVALGHAWVMRRFYSHLPKQRRDSLNRIEAWAKSKKVGLWRSSNPIPPRLWRASDRNR